MDGTFYIRADLSGDPAFIVMTATYKDGKLYSENATQIEVLDYENPDTLEIELPETIKSGEEISQFFFEDGYLQWISELRSDFRDVESPAGDFEGYEKE